MRAFTVTNLHSKEIDVNMKVPVLVSKTMLEWTYLEIIMKAKVRRTFAYVTEEVVKKFQKTKLAFFLRNICQYYKTLITKWTNFIVIIALSNMEIIFFKYTDGPLSVWYSAQGAQLTVNNMSARRA